ncbi:MAG: exodeoxyribonuclease III, partial [Myxococcota bacterium]|nr:exodeoxyribonuclease III [Myxococcota bacterium]
KQWNGVLIASKYDISDVHKGLEGSDDGQSRFIAATIQGIRFINLYCPQGQNETSEKYAYKLRFFDGLLRRLNERHNPDVPLVLLGDINIGPRSEDVFWDTEEQPNVVTHHPLELERFQSLIDWGLEDLGQRLLGEGSEGFTFWDYRTFWDWKSRRYRYDLGVRIDHFMVTAPVAERALSMQVHRKWRHKKNKIKPSDHAPVELVLSVATHGGDLGASASPS